MFNTKNNKTETPKAIERNIIAKNTKFIGEIHSDGDFRIDGILEGTLTTSGRVIIGSEGFIKGNVTTNFADIEGKFSGQLTVSKTLTVKATANITGDIIINKFSVEPGAVFNATCSMKGTVKELNKTDEKPTKEEKTAS